MKLDRNVVRRGVRALLFGMIALQLALVSGCSFSNGIKRWSWSEEVELSSGEVIVVDRWEDRRQLTGLVERGGWVFVQGGIRIKPPHSGAQPIVFEEWRHSPRAIDITAERRIYLAVLQDSGGEHKYPPPPEEGIRTTADGKILAGNLYAAFQWVDGAWVRILLTRLPEQTRVNLMLSTSPWIRGVESIDRPVVTLARKRKLHSYLDPRFLERVKDFRTTLVQ